MKNGSNILFNIDLLIPIPLSAIVIKIFFSSLSEVLIVIDGCSFLLFLKASIALLKILKNTWFNSEAKQFIFGIL